MIINTTRKAIDEFTLGYIYSALWDLKADYDLCDIYPFYLKRVVEDCRDFQEENKDLLNEFYLFSQKNKNLNDQHRISPEHLGNDYWLVRNGKDFEFIKRVPAELAQKFYMAANKKGKQKLIMEGDTLKFILDAA